MPPRAEVDVPFDHREGKLGTGDVQRWSELDSDVRVLFTWAIDQNLLVEGCCGEPAARVDQLARASLEGVRQRAPARCTGARSDLGSEDLVTNLFGKRKRLVDRDGCPIRTDIASMEIRADDPCFAGLGFITTGAPFGASIEASHARVYVRDAEGVLRDDFVAVPLELDAELPPTAVDTGFRRGGRTLWIDEADDTRIYVVDADGAEAWPRLTRTLNCA